MWLITWIRAIWMGSRWLWPRSRKIRCLMLLWMELCRHSRCTGRDQVTILQGDCCRAGSCTPLLNCTRWTVGAGSIDLVHRASGSYIHNARNSRQGAPGILDLCCGLLEGVRHSPWRVQRISLRAMHGAEVPAGRSRGRYAGRNSNPKFTPEVPQPSC